MDGSIGALRTDVTEIAEDVGYLRGRTDERDRQRTADYPCLRVTEPSLAFGPDRCSPVATVPRHGPRRMAAVHVHRQINARSPGLDIPAFPQ